MKNLRNKNQPAPVDTIDTYLSTAWDKVLTVYAALADIETLADQINGPGLNFLQATDIDTLAEVNAIFTDFQVGAFATQAEAEAGVNNTTTMTPLRTLQAIQALSTAAQNNFSATVDPTVNDDTNLDYAVGSMWVNVTSDEAFVCVDATLGAAVWHNISLLASELATVAVTGDSDDLIEGAAQLLMTTAERSKLAVIEAGATADQTGAEIKTALFAEADTNNFDDAAQTKLTNIEALADVTDSTNVAAAGAVMDSDISAAEGFLRKTGAGAYEAIKSNLNASTAPTATDDSSAGYAVGSTWINTTADVMYVCLDATASAAVWQEIGAGGGSSPLTTKGDIYGFSTVDARLPVGTNGQVLTADSAEALGIKWAAAAGGGGGMTVTTTKTTNYTASAGEWVPVDSSGGPFDVTLPASPTAQQRVTVVDVGKSCTAFPVTVVRNGKTIDGLTEDFDIDIDSGRVDLVYDGTSDWELHQIAAPLVVDATSSVVGKKQVFIRPEEMFIPGSGGPGALTKYGNAGSGPQLQGYPFDQTIVELIAMTWAWPKSADLSQGLRCRIAWSPSGTNTGDVVWQFGWFAYADGTLIDNTISTVTEWTDAGLGTANAMQYTAWSAVETGYGTPTENGLIHIRVSRNASSGSDTMTGDAQLHGVWIEYTEAAATDD